MMAAQIEVLTSPWLGGEKRRSRDSRGCAQYSEIRLEANVFNDNVVDDLLAGQSIQKSCSLVVDILKWAEGRDVSEDLPTLSISVEVVECISAKHAHLGQAKRVSNHASQRIRPESADRIQIGVVPIDRVTMAGAVDRISKHLAAHSDRQFIVTGANAQFVNIAERDPDLATFLQDADLNVADGVSLLLAARILGSKLSERVTGIDLMVELCGLAADTNRTVYLLGGMEGAADGAATFLRAKYPQLRIVGIDRPPVGREFDPLVVSGVRDPIIEAEPHFLFVCLGVPRQEKWIQQFGAGLPVKVIMGNGAAFDVLAGFFHRPPMWVQNIGLEWFYRLCMEPTRLWRRYLLGNILFAEQILAQSLSHTWRPS